THTTSVGKALLSELSDEEIDKIYPEEKLEPLTSKTITNKTELKRRLKQIKETGVAIAKEEARNGVWAVSSVIRDSTGRCTAALSISTPLIRMNEKRLESFVGLVKLGAGLISYRLGYRGLSNPVTNLEDIFSWWDKNGVEIKSETELRSAGIEQLQ
ncbi:IclR family transcriptional regulator, partial [Chloroflexota bacterium]